jgi:hypothetical protein
MEEFSTRLMQLILDPQFAAFERLASRPNLFRIVGRTHTETWHSMFLGWLLDREGSHGLGDFAVRRLLLAVTYGGEFQPKDKAALALNLAAFGEFKEAKVVPSEHEQQEKNIREDGGRSGRLDVFMSKIGYRGAGHDGAVIVIEQKVWADVDDEQCARYSAWLEKEHAGKAHVCILLAPLGDSGESPIEDKRWLTLDYQVFSDEVLVPILEHPDLNDGVRRLIQEYADALRIPMNGATKLAISQEERDLAKRLFDRHEKTFESLFLVLLDTIDSPELEKLVEERAKSLGQAMVIAVGGSSIRGTSASELLKAAVVYLGERNKLTPLIPYSTGSKRYLVAAEARHPNGNEFNNPVTVMVGGVTYVIEANVNRQSAMKYAANLLRKAGFDDVEITAG